MAPVPNQFEGSAFHDSLPRGRASGTVTVSSEGVRYSSEHGEMLLPLRGLRIEMGGASHRLVYFRHPGNPDWTIYTADRSILKHPVLTSDQGTSRHLARIKGGSRHRTLLTLTIFGILLMPFVLLAVFRKQLVGVAVDRIPVSIEKKLGEAAWEQYGADLSLVEDKAILAEFKKITDRLNEGLTDKRYDFEFHIARDEQVNAFALPGGKVVVNSGLITKVDSAEEVAAVLGHEIAHVTRRHGLRGVVETVGIVVLVQVLVGDGSALITGAVQASAFLMRQKFSRDNERDADNVGWDYLLAADISPKAMVRMQQRLLEIEEESAISMPGMLSTHPPSAERVAYLEARLGELDPAKTYRPIDVNFADLQARLKGDLEAVAAAAKQDAAEKAAGDASSEPTEAPAKADDSDAVPAEVQVEAPAIP